MLENEKPSVNWHVGMLTQGAFPISDIVAICPSGKVEGRAKEEIFIYPDTKCDGTLVSAEDTYAANYKDISEIKAIFKNAGANLIHMMDDDCNEYLVNEKYRDTVGLTLVG